MNFLFLILSIFFSTVTPSNFSNEGSSSNNHVNVKKATDDGGKKDKMGNGDFIIGNDTNP